MIFTLAEFGVRDSFDVQVTIVVVLSKILQGRAELSNTDLPVAAGISSFPDKVDLGI